MDQVNGVVAKRVGPESLVAGNQEEPITMTIMTMKVAMAMGIPNHVHLQLMMTTAMRTGHYFRLNAIKITQFHITCVGNLIVRSG